eukprot:UN09228
MFFKKHELLFFRMSNTKNQNHFMKPILDIPTFFPKMALVVIIKSFLPYFSLFLDGGMEEVASSKNILGKSGLLPSVFP